MREYGSIHTCFWTDPVIQELPHQAKLLALYLLSGPHTNMMGCFRLPIGYVAEDLQWSFETVTQQFEELLKIGFIVRDEQSGWVVINNFLKWNTIENPNQGRSIIRLFEQVPQGSTVFKQLIIVLLQHTKHLDENFINRLRTVLQQLANQEQDQEQEQEQKQDHNYIVPSEQNSPSPKMDAVETIFTHWRATLNHPQARLDERRQKIIQCALKLGYSVEQLCEAVTGCSLTPHNMGANDQGERYDGLHIIFKSADQIDRFRKNFLNPPRPHNKAEKRVKENINAAKNWLNNKLPPGASSNE